jgi:uncharacterized RDD family membrane protein YckC
MTRYGGFWERFAAWLIDTIILSVAGGILGLFLGGGLGALMATSGSDADSIGMTAGLAGNGLGIVLNWLYFAIMESSSRQATVGKLALGLTVTDENGYQLGFGRATGRYFAKYVSLMILGFGFLMVGWTQRKQGLHDMIASTLVVRRGTMGDAAQVDVFR